MQGRLKSRLQHHTVRLRGHHRAGCGTVHRCTPPPVHDPSEPRAPHGTRPCRTCRRRPTSRGHCRDFNRRGRMPATVHTPARARPRPNPAHPTALARAGPVGAGRHRGVIAAISIAGDGCTRRCTSRLRARAGFSPLREERAGRGRGRGAPLPARTPLSHPTPRPLNPCSGTPPRAPSHGTQPGSRSSPAARTRTSASSSGSVASTCVRVNAIRPRRRTSACSPIRARRRHQRRSADTHASTTSLQPRVVQRNQQPPGCVQRGGAARPRARRPPSRPPTPAARRTDSARPPHRRLGRPPARPRRDRPQARPSAPPRAAAPARAAPPPAAPAHPPGTRASPAAPSPPAERRAPPPPTAPPHPTSIESPAARLPVDDRRRLRLRIRRCGEVRIRLELRGRDRWMIFRRIHFRSRITSRLRSTIGHFDQLREWMRSSDRAAADRRAGRRGRAAADHPASAAGSDAGADGHVSVNAHEAPI